MFFHLVVTCNLGNVLIPAALVNDYFGFSLLSVVSGNGDGDIFFQKTKFDSTGRSGGGLKRSSSSPNINKVSNLMGGRVILLYESKTHRSTTFFTEKPQGFY